MHDWILVEAGLPEPTPGSVLEGTGVRVRGALERVDHEAVEGIVRGERATGAEAQTVEYLVTGSVLEQVTSTLISAPDRATAGPTWS